MAGELLTMTLNREIINARRAADANLIASIVCRDLRGSRQLLDHFSLISQKATRLRFLFEPHFSKHFSILEV